MKPMQRLPIIEEIVEEPPPPSPVPVPAPAPAAVPGPNYTHLAGKVHIHLLLPCYGCMMRQEFFLSLMQLQVLSTKLGIAVSTDFLGNESLITRGRNILAAKFLKGPGTHMLFIDSDIAFDPMAVFKCVAFDKDVVSLLYPKKHISWEAVKRKLHAGETEPIHAMGLDYNLNIHGTEAQVVDGSFIRVLDTATGFMMVKREALQRITDHYAPSCTAVNDITNSKDIVPEYACIFDTMIDPESRRYLSEDYAFCRRAQALDIEIWADIMSPLSHIGSNHMHGDMSQRFEMVLCA